LVNVDDIPLLVQFLSIASADDNVLVFSISILINFHCVRVLDVDNLGIIILE
jgi:hypothetical protein